ncbi:MAG: hypothetical protein KatS3mg059_0862 [Thermomicrobiales bacterium]|nr:MAG: hypothetical protein KatS3mg059_0862 [Thermomicrobiales bacterium]
MSDFIDYLAKAVAGAPDPSGKRQSRRHLLRLLAKFGVAISGTATVTHLNPELASAGSYVYTRISNLNCRAGPGLQWNVVTTVGPCGSRQYSLRTVPGNEYLGLCNRYTRDWHEIAIYHGSCYAWAGYLQSSRPSTCPCS